MTEADSLGGTFAPPISYSVVTTVRDDAPNLERLTRCLLDQTQSPRCWVIVDDGSTDETRSTAQSLALRASWITVVRKGGQNLPTRGAPIAEAFEFGLRQVRGSCDVVVKLDADVSMSRDFFSRLLREFERDAKLGIASGTRFEKVHGEWQQRFLTGTSVEAQFRAYRVDCLDVVLPLDKHRGWDGVDVIKARLHGWRTGVFRDLPFRHHRAIGARDGSKWTAWTGQGLAAYSMGYRPLYLLSRAVFHATKEPAALALLVGYASGFVGRLPKTSREIRTAVRRDQRLRTLPSRSREVRGIQTAAPQPTTQSADLLLVAEAGGHLHELHALRPVWENKSRVWVSVDSVHSRSLLSNESVVFARGPTCRSIWNLVRNLWIGWKVVGQFHPRVIIATGSGVVVPLIWVGRLRHIPTIYVECAGRVDRPSLSCRLVAPVADFVYVQWPEQKDMVRSARYAGTIRWEAATRIAATCSHGRVFATVGTSPSYPFDRLVRSLTQASLVRPVTIQHGISAERPVGATMHDFLPFDQMNRHVADADVVVTHGGIGSVLLALSHRKRLVVMPRRHAFGEHVDDHQLAFASRLQEAGLATVVENEDQLTAFLEHPPAAAATPAAQLEPSLTDELVRLTQRLLSDRTTLGGRQRRRVIRALGSCRSRRGVHAAAPRDRVRR